MKDDEAGFKITDRRHRSLEDAGAPPAPAPPAAPAPAPETRPLPPPEPADPGPADALDLRHVFMMFGSSALMGLGEAADPVTGDRHVDLEQAEEAIDVLMLLRDRTEGRRTAEESAFLDDLLYDLHTRFVRFTGDEPPRVS